MTDPIDVKRSNILEQIRLERERQFSLSGSDWDVDKTPNDWIAVITAYLGQCSRHKALTPGSEDFQEMMTKVAAIAVAALEHLDIMIEKKHLRFDKSSSEDDAHFVKLLRTMLKND